MADDPHSLEPDWRHRVGSLFRRAQQQDMLKHRKLEPEVHLVKIGDENHTNRPTFGDTRLTTMIGAADPADAIYLYPFEVPGRMSLARVYSKLADWDTVGAPTESTAEVAIYKMLNYRGELRPNFDINPNTFNDEVRYPIKKDGLPTFELLAVAQRVDFNFFGVSLEWPTLCDFRDNLLLTRQGGPYALAIKPGPDSHAWDVYGSNSTAGADSRMVGYVSNETSVGRRNFPQTVTAAHFAPTRPICYLRSRQGINIYPLAVEAKIK